MNITMKKFPIDDKFSIDCIDLVRIIKLTQALFVDWHSNDEVVHDYHTFSIYLYIYIYI